MKFKRLSHIDLYRIHVGLHLKNIFLCFLEEKYVIYTWDISDLCSFIDGSDVNQTPILWKNKGDNATIHCNHTKGINYFQMYWYRQVPGENIKLIVFTTTAKPDHDFGDFDKKKFSATKPDAESGTFTVENLDYNQPAYFGQGTKLTREITPPTVKVFQPSSKECRNLKDEKERKKTLLCVARDFYPDHVSIFWQVNAKNVTKGVATDPAARLDDKTYFITSRLRVHAEVWTSPGTNFSCFVTFFDGNKTIIKDETVFAVEGMFMWNSEIT
uniref:Ig-like domain-containing protein n=1 Tax=Seriola lalandi dorsalis TaxID=1841481 RepID=A0A3B4XPT9_SERLL